MKKFLNKSNKTTITGIAIAVLTYLLATKIIDTNMWIMITGVLTAIGFGAAKDGDKTGL